MSTQAKYSWAIGLVVVGIVFALPFRQTNSTQVANTQDVEATEGAAANTASQPLLNDSVGSSNAKASPSKLLPSVPGFVEKNQNRVPTVEPQKLTHGMKSFNDNDNNDNNEIVSDDRPANLQPVEFSNQIARKARTEATGDDQMRPVPTSRFLAASQSNANSGQVFSTASRTRNVVHYRLRDGDTLRSIAQRYLNDPNRYNEILNDNAHIFTNGENFLPIGQFITIIVQ